MFVKYLGHYGDDKTVVNAARVSFGKAVSEFRPVQDGRLLAFLARHKHELPFAHPHVSFHFKAPIFVARQLAKHQVGFVWSEISRRYVNDEPELYWPPMWRKGSPDIKQGSTDEPWEDDKGIMERSRAAIRTLVFDYRRMIQDGCCAEQARMVLPQNAYTEWHWTGSLLGWSRVWNLRVKPDAQRETKQSVEMIGEQMSTLFPYSWRALTNAQASL
jgi:thymidylate synthase (FAD)